MCQISFNWLLKAQKQFKIELSIIFTETEFKTSPISYICMSTFASIFPELY